MAIGNPPSAESALCNNASSVALAGCSKLFGPIQKQPRFSDANSGPLARPLNCFIKRAFDLAVSVPVVALLLPLCALLVFLVQRLQSPGPLFCVQRRVGRYGRPFNAFKFRTMHMGRRCNLIQSAADGLDIYPAGRLLRRRSVDELPQFINVIRGEMSVVGPRPFLPTDDEVFGRCMPDYRVRSTIRPGITGLAQASGLRGRIKAKQDIILRVEADIMYIRAWSLALDCSLILRTISAVIFPPPTAF